MPARLDDGTVAYINLFSQKAFKYESGKQVQIDLPDIGHRFEGLIQAMYEAIAETDETLMEKFFEGEPFTTEEIVTGMAAGVRTGQITPVFCGSAVNLQALDMLLYNMKELLPSAATAAVVGENADSEPVEITVDDTAPTCAYVFKTVADPFVGKLSFIKVLSGKLSATSNVINARTGQPERLGKTLTVCGKNRPTPPPLWPVILAQLPNWPPPRPAIPYAIPPVLSPCPPPATPLPATAWLSGLPKGR